MKTNRIVLFIAILLMAVTFVFCYLNTNKQHPVSVVLQLSLTTKDKVSIDQKSIDSLKSVINDNMIINDQEKLIEAFNQEKSNYINLITIISILLTVFSLFTALSSFVEKNELNKLSLEMSQKIKEYEGELQNIYFNTLISYIQKTKDSYIPGKVRYIDDGVKVTDLPLFLKLVNIELNGIFDYVIKKDLSERILDKQFYIEFMNLGNAMIAYGESNKFITNKNLDVDSNEAFRVVINYAYSNLGKKNFEKFKETIDSFLTIKWGNY